jgi:tripartite-type tricarboxylate transporter receptor subunit TctC
MRLERRQVLKVAGAAIAALRTRRGLAQSYPVRPVRVIVPFAPGGVTDVLARLVAEKMSERLGRQFYVENHAGGSGNTGMGLAAKAAPDGYTILTAYSSFVVNPALFDQLPYDPVKDFAPVSLAVTSPTVLVVNPAVPVASVKELVALVRANPGKYSYASAGAGTMSHLVGEQFRLTLGLDIVHVPFNGGSPSALSVVAGHTPIGLSSPTAAGPLIRDGKLRPLAVTSKARALTLPDVVTLAEAGYPNIEGESFVGFAVPARTPPDIIALLNGAIVASIAQPPMRERLVELGDDPLGSTPEEFGRRIKAELALWDRVIRAANIKPQ